MDEMQRQDNAHLYTIIKVSRDEDLLEQIGNNIYFDLVDHEKVRSFRVQKQTPFKRFKEEVAREFGVPVQFQRFWLWAKRQNGTYRPNQPLTVAEEALSVGQFRKVPNKANNAELKLFLEVELGPNKMPIAPPLKTEEEILLFFKLYDPLNEEIRYIGRLFVKGYAKPFEILTKLNEMAGFDAEEEIDLFEEIKFEPSVMCEHIDPDTTFRASELGDGDIICFQKSQVGNEQCRYPDIPSFLEYVCNRQVVRFRSLERPKKDECHLELSKLHTYDDVAEKIAQHLGLNDPLKIMLTSHNSKTGQPKPQSIKYQGVDRLTDMLVHRNQTSDILYYEILDTPLLEQQGLKTLKVSFHHATKDKVVIHRVTLPKQSSVGDVIIDLKSKVELSNPEAEIRLLEVFYHKIYKIFPLNEKIDNINDQYWTLRAEEIPEEEKNFGPRDRLMIHVYHFMKDTSQIQQVQNFGEPFLLVIHEDETLAEVKVRIQKKLQIPDEQYAKWKFAFLLLGRPEYLQDSDIVASRFQLRDVYGAWEQYLGLEHTDNTPKSSCIANQGKNSSPFAEFDAMFSKIQNLLEENTSESNNSNNFCAKEIADAEEVSEQCLKMDIKSVIQSGKAPEFVKSLSILLTQGSFPINTVEKTTEILTDFVQSCEQYETAKQYLSEAQENENSVCELKTTLKQLFSKFTPVRSFAEAVDQEIARLEKQTTERKAQKVELRKKLEDLNAQAIASNEALVCGEKKLKLSLVKKEESEKIIKDFERSWEFLKDLRRPQA